MSEHNEDPGMNEKELEKFGEELTKETEEPKQNDSEVKEERDNMSFKIKWFHEFEKNIKEQKDKIVVLTGTTSGTGNIATRTALKKGASVVLLNRNVDKAKKSLADFFEAHEGSESRTTFIKCDLQDFESVEEAAEEVTKLFNEEGFDVLVNNAGVMALEDKATKDGYDLQMQTNHLSHFKLTLMLYPLLEKRAEKVGEARVVNHSSFLRLWPPTALKSKYFQKKGGNLGGDGTGMTTGGRWQRYHQTKLANSAFTVEMQKRLKKANSKVFAVCAHPGIAATSLHDTSAKGGGMKSARSALKNSQSQEDGTMGLLKCIFDDNLKKGGLYGPKGFTGRPKSLHHGYLTTAKAGKLLWKESEKAVGEFKIGKD